MIELETSVLYKAISDYLYLLDNDYPVKPILKIIGDRYRLNAIQRSILFRGVAKKEICMTRKLKLIKTNKVYGNKLLIDFYNVIISISSYLKGKFVYIALDGLLRDASESHGRIKEKNIMNHSLNLLIDYIKKINTKEVIFAIDSPVSHSKELAGELQTMLENHNIKGNTVVIKSADYYLKNSYGYICATSDSSIIDCIDKVFDLAFWVLKDKYNPQFFRLCKAR